MGGIRSNQVTSIMHSNRRVSKFFRNDYLDPLHSVRSNGINQQLESSLLINIGKPFRKTFRIEISPSYYGDPMFRDNNCIRGLGDVVRVAMIGHGVGTVCIELSRDYRLGHVEDTVTWCEILDEEFSMDCHNKLLGDIRQIIFLHSLRDEYLECRVIDEGAQQACGVGVMVE